MPLIAVIPLMIPILALTIPIVAILTGHQRRMAEIMHQNGGLGSQADARVLYELDCLRKELADVRNLLNQQTIAIDNLTPRLPSSTTSGEKLEKLGL